MTDPAAGRWHRLHLWLTGLPYVLRVGNASVLLLACAIADHFTGSEISLSIAYLAPTAFAAWYAGNTAGFSSLSPRQQHGCWSTSHRGIPTAIC